MSITDKPSTFEGTARVVAGGVYEFIVYAFDPNTGNTGVDKTTINVSSPR